MHEAKTKLSELVAEVEAARTLEGQGAHGERFRRAAQRRGTRVVGARQVRSWGFGKCD